MFWLWLLLVLLLLLLLLFELKLTGFISALLQIGLQSFLLRLQPLPLHVEILELIPGHADFWGLVKTPDQSHAFQRAFLHFFHVL